MAYCESGLRFRDLQLAFFVIIMEALSKTQSLSHSTKGWAALAPPSVWKGYTPALEAWTEFGFLLIVCAVQLIVLCCASVITAYYLFSRKYPIVNYNYLVIGLILGNFGHCFNALMMIWDYENPELFLSMVNIFALSSSFVAVHVWAGTSPLHTLAIITAGWSARAAVQYGVKYHLGYTPTPVHRVGNCARALSP